MKFVHPEILWALGALAIPIIVHLFNFRKFKKVLFSNVEFLKEIKQETQSKSKLKHLLILISRMLAMAFIILAFAQPYIPAPGTTKKPGGTAVSVYIDNSYSMEGENEDGRLLELAKNKAIEIVSAYQPIDKFQLLTSDFEGRHQRLVSKDEMIELIQEVDVSAAARNISEVVSRQRDLLNNSGLDNKRSFLLTDLQANVSDYSAIQNDSTIHFNLVPNIANDVGNIYIDSVWFDTPVRQLNQPEVLNMRIANTGDDARDNVPVQLNINGQQKSVASANIEASGNSVVQMTFTNTDPGYKNCELVLDDNSITKDDAYYFSFDVAAQIAVLEIKAASTLSNAVATVYADDPYFAFSTVSEGTIDFGAFKLKNLIVLNQLSTLTSGLVSEIEKFVDAGGSVFILPASNADIATYNDLLSRIQLGQMGPKATGENKINSVSYEHFIFKNAFEKTSGNIDMPIVKAWYPLQISSSTMAEPLMLLQTGTPFMLSSTHGKGRAYMCAVSLTTEENNFTNHAFFPTTLLRVAEFSQATAQLAYALGKEQAITLRNLNTTGEETFKLRNVQSGLEFIPEHRNAAGNTEIFIHPDLNVAGNYALMWGQNQTATLSFNYDRKESDTRAVPADQVQTELSDKGYTNWNILTGNLESIAAGAGEITDGKKYWLSMIVWALIFLAIEILLIKFWR